ncbi:AMP-binding protein [Finegoldia sp. P3-F-LR]|uniref:AMP-binding protein n=1 Tax=Peptoniphilaceae TaxID=1570339 RepID=UPI0024AE5B15|nr:AMP-binding protein [Peptoniphilus sp. Marseille-Q7072]
MNIELKEKLEKFYDENVWEHITIGEFISECANKYGDKIAVVDDEKEYSYKDLEASSIRCANGLLKVGFKPGDKIVLQLPNCYEFIVIMFAMFKIGVIPVLSLPAHRKNEIKGIIEKSEAKAYISMDKYLGFSYVDMIRDIRRELHHSIEVYILGDSQEYKNFLILNDNIDQLKQKKLDYKTLCLLLLSSGTTDTPKLIPIRDCELLCAARDIGNRLCFSSKTKYLVSLSISHKFALAYPGIIGTFYYGGEIILCKTSSPDEILSKIEYTKPTVTALVPTLANLCIEYLAHGNFENSTLEVLQIGGSVLNGRNAKEIENKFRCPISQLYGMTEGLVTCTQADDEVEIRHYTQGKPASIYDDAKIVNEEGKCVADGEFGELCIRGPYTIYEYYKLNEFENNKLIDSELYFKTGDRARRLPDGNYQITGRLDQIINKGGEKINPSELENLLLEREDIAEVRIIGVPDKILGQKICVFILKKNEDIDLIDLISFLKKKNLAEFKMPDMLKKLQEWPLTGTGKINKKELLKLAMYD